MKNVYVTMRLDLRDIWIGVYWTRVWWSRQWGVSGDPQLRGIHVYICLIPCFPICITWSVPLPYSVDGPR